MKRSFHPHLNLAGSLAIAGAVAWFAWQHAGHEEAVTKDLGIVLLNAPRDFEVTLSNPDPVPHELRSVTPGCSCMVVLDAPRTVPAKGSAITKMRFTPEKFGPTRVDLRMDWAALAPTIWHVVGEVIPPPEALPSTADLSVARKYLSDGTILAAAAAVAGGPKRLVIDVRSAADFQQSNIEGSMNIPLQNLASLAGGLRQRSALLVDRGLGSAATLELANRLRSEGWNELRVLEGGVPAWQANGGILSAMPRVNLRLVSSSEAQQYCTRPGWVVVTPRSLATSLQIKEALPNLITYDGAASPDQIAADVSHQLQQRRPGEGSLTTALHVLLATESGENTSTIAEELQSKSVGMPVFVLNGGLRGYMDHLRSTRPSGDRRWVTLAEYRGVAADLRARQRLVSACSSCPK